MTFQGFEQQQRHAEQEALADLADKYLEEAIANGATFDEWLCNWALNKAAQGLQRVL